MQLMMKVLKYELMNPSVDFFGMMITLFGGEVSGHQLTTIFNCVLNLFYLMYSWHVAGYPLSEFFEHVEAVLLGDDHVLCVDPTYNRFHHTHIKNVLEGLGLGYTMADKEAPSVPYITLSEASFLKRDFHYDMELGAVVGRLEWNSIIKMLTIQVVSRKVLSTSQLAQAITSAVSESFFHGRKKFNELVKFIEKLDKSESLVQQMRTYPYLSYEGYRRRYWDASGKDEVYDTDLQSHKSLMCISYCSSQGKTLQGQERMEYTGYHARAFPENHIYGSVEHDTKESFKGGECKVIHCHENYNLSKTNEQMNSIPSDVPEAAGTSELNNQQTVFLNETAPETLDLSTPHDPTVSSQLTTAHLADFLSRPAKLTSFTWAENAAAGNIATMNPWILYFSNPNIKSKLQSFGMIRCTLKIKITINASQFYYGSLGAFYTPMAGYVPNTTGSGSGSTGGFQILQSQKPHVWLDPQNTSTAVMTLPFLYPMNWLPTTSAGEFQAMGKIDFTQYANLRSANGVTTGGVSIVVYGWAEDVEITALTSVPVLQAKKEYAPNGQISGPASTVASVARKLTNVPIIGPFAKATDQVASTLGSVADFFGFTNVPNVRDVEPMKSVAFHTLSSSQISEPINKLSLQPKQEISVSSTHVGDTYGDQMHIGNFCQRESFLCGGLWTTSQIEDTILFTSAVTPELYEKSGGTNYNVYYTPMAYALKMFQYWRGDLIYRFKVVRTQYHRGRINICWDAAVYNSSNMPSYGNPNVRNIVFDLEETDEVEVRVPYMQPLPFQSARDAPDNALGRVWDNGTSPSISLAAGTCNGMLQVRVINRLTAPEASSDVDILVFVRMADNVEYAGPRDINAFTQLQLQSKKEFKQQDLGGNSISDPRTYDEIFGEKIVSFRELLHRQSKAWTQVIPKNADWAGNQMMFMVPFQRLPRPYGYTTWGWESAKGVNTPASDYGFNYSRVHPLNWLSACFLGYKGSTNWTFNVVNNDGKASRAVSSVSVTRRPYSYAGSNKPYCYSTAGSNSTNVLMRNLNTGQTIDQQGAAGMALTNQYTQAGVSVNLPYYSRYKFFTTNFPAYYSLTQNGTEAELDWYEFSMKRGITTPSTTDADVLVDLLCGTGPDFDLVFFINCPMTTYLPSPTPT